MKRRRRSNAKATAKAMALERAFVVREQFRAKGGKFLHKDFLAELAMDTEFIRLAEEAGRPIIVQWAGSAVDDQSAEESDQPSDQPNLPGVDWEGQKEGEFRLGEGWRIARRYATRRQLRDWLAQDEANLMRVTEASQRKHKVVEQVLPYMEDDQTTFAEAIDSYLADHPDGDGEDEP